MEYRRLGHTDVEVSVICLGTMTWGEQNTEAEAHAQLDAAVDGGVNFIDAAEIYPVPTRAETYGATERIIGSWLKRRTCRERVILATKAAGPADWLPWVRDGYPRFNRDHLERALDGSLKRLGTDYVDLYQLHWPERATNFFGELGYVPDPDESPVPIRETLEALNGFVQAGKVRHIGLSNETPWGMMTFLRTAEQEGWPRPVSVQNPYSLLNRTFEIGCAEAAIREHMGLLAYSPLGFGVLSGKYEGAPPKGSRLALKAFSSFTRYTGPAGRSATAAYVKLFREHGLDPAQAALAYVHRRPFTTSTIIGATRLEQLQANLQSAELSLAPEVLKGIEDIHARHPNPCP